MGAGGWIILKILDPHPKLGMLGQLKDPGHLWINRDCTRLPALSSLIHHTAITIKCAARKHTVNTTLNLAWLVYHRSQWENIRRLNNFEHNCRIIQTRKFQTGQPLFHLFFFFFSLIFLQGSLEDWRKAAFALLAVEGWDNLQWLLHTVSSRSSIGPEGADM